MSVPSLSPTLTTHAKRAMVSEKTCSGWSRRTPVCLKYWNHEGFTVFLALIGFLVGLVLYAKQLRDARTFSETIWFTSTVIPSYVVAAALQWLNHDSWATYSSGAASVGISTVASFALAILPVILFSDSHSEAFPLPKADGLKIAFALIVVSFLVTLSVSLIGTRDFACTNRKCSNSIWLVSYNHVFAKDFIGHVLASAFLLSIILRIMNFYYSWRSWSKKDS